MIASTADAGKNLLDTGTLTYSNIENSAHYSASSIGIGAGGASSGMAPVGPNGLMPSIGVPQSDSSHSTTMAGIAEGTIVVRNGNADLSALDRNPDINAQGLKPIFDAQKVQEQQEMGQVAGYVGMRTAGDIADYMANHASTEAEQKSWQDGGTNKIILHGLVGAGTAALGNGDVVQGATGAVLSEAASGKMQDYLRGQGIDPYSAEGKSLMNLASAAIGGAAGGGAGAATALQGEQNNRQLHESEKQRVSQLANGDAQTEARLSAASCALVHCSAEYAADSPEYAYYSQLEAVGNQPDYAGERALLQQQTFSYMGIGPDGKAVSTTESLFTYDKVDQAVDYGTYLNNSYGHPITRAGGALQAIGGAASAVTGSVLAAGGAAACPESLGAGCGVAVGGTLLAGWGVDQLQAGGRTAWNGTSTQTLGGYAIQQAFGISPQAAEMLYGAVGVAGGMSLGAVAADLPALPMVRVSVPVASGAVDAEAGGAAPLRGAAIDNFYGQAAQDATHNATSSEVILGRYIAGSPDSYDAVAQARGSTYFSMGNWSGVSGEIGSAPMWNINQAFLDQQMVQGKTFTFTGDPRLAMPGSYTSQELNYLTSKGHSIFENAEGMYRATK